MIVVGPGYYLVCYNNVNQITKKINVVGPGYYLVCYNFTHVSFQVC